MNPSNDPNSSGRALVENIKERVSIVDIVSKYVKLTPGGKNLRGNCPLHGEKTPSFYVSPVEGYWKCFGCGKGGDVIAFIQEIEKVSFREALTYLAEIAGIDVRMSAHSSSGADGEDAALYALLGKAKDFYCKELSSNKAAREYLVSRGVSDDMIAKFQIGYAPDNWQTLYNHIRQSYSDKIIIDSGLGIQGKKGVYDRFRSRIMFPTHDVRDRVVTFSGRIWSETGEYQTERPDAGKYVNGPESVVYHKSRTLFGLNLARQSAVQKKRLIVVEGHLDCILAHQLGFTETVAVGGTAFTDEHAQIVKRYCDHVILAFDGDSAGQKAVLRSLPTLFKHNFTVTIARFPAGKDPADIAQESKTAFVQAIESSTDYVTHRLRQLREEGIPLSEIDRILKQEIYPLLATVSNPLLIDAAVVTIARSVGASDDSVIREHILKSRPVPSDSETVGTHTEPHVSTIPDVRDWALKFVIVWIEARRLDATIDSSVSRYLDGAAGIQVANPDEFLALYSITEPEYKLKFEWLYGTQEPKDILPAIIKQFADTYVRDTMQRYMTSLHQVVDMTERASIEQAIVKLSNYKRYSETHKYDN